MVSNSRPDGIVVWDADHALPSDALSFLRQRRPTKQSPDNTWIVGMFRCIVRKKMADCWLLDFRKETLIYRLRKESPLSGKKEKRKREVGKAATDSKPSDLFHAEVKRSYKRIKNPPQRITSIISWITNDKFKNADCWQTETSSIILPIVFSTSPWPPSVEKPSGRTRTEI